MSVFCFDKLVHFLRMSFCVCVLCAIQFVPFGIPYTIHATDLVSYVW